MSEQSQLDDQPVRSNRKVKFIFGDDDSTVSRSASLSSPIKQRNSFSELSSPNTLHSNDSNNDTNLPPPSPISVTSSNPASSQFNNILTAVQPPSAQTTNQSEDTPLVSRTQRKLLLQREYSMVSEEGNDTLDISHLNKELDRAHKEYAWVRKHYDPIGDSLHRLSQLRKNA